MAAPDPRRTESLPLTTVVSPGLARSRALNRSALEDPNRFWAPVADELHWFERSGPLFEPTESPPYGRWFPQWTSNLAYNCLDRWRGTPRWHRVAFHWEGEPGDRRALTYAELHRESERFAAGLRAAGVGAGDRVTLYLPMVPELPIAMLATARIGAIHSVVFGGFAASALAERVRDSGSRLVVTADGGWRRGKVVELKRTVDEALRSTPSVEKVVVVRRTGQPVASDRDRDVDYADFLRLGRGPVAPVPRTGSQPTYILYTSGTTGRPKGAVHGTGGYMLWSYYTMRSVFGLGDADLYWCTADIGWVTGHTYVVYGPLLTGATSLLYEGAPDSPKPDRWWDLIERHGVTVLYTSPTAIRSAMKHGDPWPRAHDLSSLRLLGTVGEPINPEAWHWYFREIGGGRCPIVDTWWQTETGGILISPQPGLAAFPLKPGSATLPLPGVDAAVVDEQGRPLPPNEKGLIVLRRPWPGVFLTLWGDEERYREVYFRRFPGAYYPADFCLVDDDGYFWLLGRADEVLKVAGHRISTTEIEDALITHPAVAESAVIGRHDDLRGESPVACVILRPGHAPSPTLRQELADRVRATVGAVAVPSAIYFVEKVPKTRSAKIMRRLIRDVVEERPLGDTSTLEDETSIEEARRAYEELKRELARPPP